MGRLQLAFFHTFFHTQWVRQLTDVYHGAAYDGSNYKVRVLSKYEYLADHVNGGHVIGWTRTK